MEKYTLNKQPHLTDPVEITAYKQNNDDLKQLLHRLHRDRRNTSALIEVVWSYFFLFLAFLLVSQVATWWSVGLAFLVVGVMQYRVVMSVHEASHKTLFFPERLNEWVGVLHASMVGVTFIRYRQQHNAHHRAGKMDKDPDAYIYQPILLAHPGWRRVGVWIFGVFPEILEKFLQKGVGESSNSRNNGTVRKHSLCVLLMQCVLLVTLSLALGWWAYFVLWLAPLLTIAVFLNRTRVTIEHGLPQYQQLIVKGSSAEVNTDTIDILTNPVDRFIFAPFAFNYHYTHHRIPSVPHYSNHQLSAFFDQYDEHSTYRVRTSYPALLIKLLWSPTC
ncbi:MAG: fatty acid desaturase [Xenococcus sp. MO_188.B8]|nr:fatty acid desaturase [Xenococcus sp. MO_188.B8]